MNLTLPLAFLFFVLAGEGLLLWAAWALLGPRRPDDRHLSPWYITFLLVGQGVFPFAWFGLVGMWKGLSPVTQADCLAVAHFSFVVGVILVQVLVLIGWWLNWNWVRNYWLRMVHLVLIVLVTVQTAVDFECPFTTWERELRDGDLENLADASPVGRFCNRALYTRVPDLTPMLIRYLCFMAVVIASWYFAPPRWRDDPPQSSLS